MNGFDYAQAHYDSMEHPEFYEIEEDGTYWADSDGDYFVFNTPEDAEGLAYTLAYEIISEMDIHAHCEITVSVCTYMLNEAIDCSPEFRELVIQAAHYALDEEEAMHCAN